MGISFAITGFIAQNVKVSVKTAAAPESPMPIPFHGFLRLPSDLSFLFSAFLIIMYVSSILVSIISLSLRFAPRTALKS